MSTWRQHEIVTMLAVISHRNLNFFTLRTYFDPALHVYAWLEVLFGKLFHIIAMLLENCWNNEKKIKHKSVACEAISPLWCIRSKPATFPRPSSYSFGSTVLGQSSKQTLNAAVSSPSVRKVKWVPVDLSCFLTKSCEEYKIRRSIRYFQMEQMTDENLNCY